MERGQGADPVRTGRPAYSKMLLSLQVLKTSTTTQQKLWLPTEYSGDICYAANAMCVMQATPTTRRRPYHVTCMYVIYNMVKNQTCFLICTLQVFPTVKDMRKAADCRPNKDDIVSEIKFGFGRRKIGIAASRVVGGLFSDSPLH